MAKSSRNQKQKKKKETMKYKIHTALGLVAFALAVSAGNGRAQSIYATPYAFTNFAGLPERRAPGRHRKRGAVLWPRKAWRWTARATSMWPIREQHDSEDHSLRSGDDAGGQPRRDTAARTAGSAARFNSPDGVAVDMRKQRLCGG